jgi:hypothetical protein
LRQFDEQPDGTPRVCDDEVDQSGTLRYSRVNKTMRESPGVDAQKRALPPIFEGGASRDKQEKQRDTQGDTMEIAEDAGEVTYVCNTCNVWVSRKTWER